MDDLIGTPDILIDSTSEKIHTEKRSKNKPKIKKADSMAINAQLYSEVIEDIARKIRTVKQEFSADWDEHMVICSPYRLGLTVLEYKHIYVPTLVDITLAECEGYLAREFENA